MGVFRPSPRIARPRPWIGSKVFARKNNTAEGGSHGTAVTTGNSGGGSGDAWNTVVATGGAITFDNTRPHRETLAYKFSQTGAGNTYVSWGTSGTRDLDVTYFRAYINFDALPTGADAAILRLIDATVSGMCGVHLLTTGKLRLTDDAIATIADSTATLAADTWYRIEVRVAMGTSSTGVIELRLYVGDSTTPTETMGPFTGRSLGAAPMEQTFLGADTSVTPDTVLDIFFDDIALDAYDWIGASPIEVKPAALALTLTPVAPTVTQQVAPAALSLTLSPVAPQVDQAVNPAAVGLTLSPVAPSITQEVAPAAISLTLTPVAPRIDQLAVEPGAIALTLTPLAPTVQNPQDVSPAALALTLTPVAPTVTQGLTVAPDPIALTLTPVAPEVRQQLDPAALALTLTPVAPQVNIQLDPTAIALVLTPVAPSLTQGPTVISPAALTLVLGFPAPSVVIVVNVKNRHRRPLVDEAYREGLIPRARSRYQGSFPGDRVR